MADKSSASRQRRTNQNRAARQSLATRRAAAAEKAAAQAKAEEDADKAVKQALKTQPKGQKSQKSSGTSAKGSLKSRAAVKPDVIDDDVSDSGRPSRTSGRATSRQVIDDEDPPARAARPGRPKGPSPVPEYGPGLRGWFDGVREVPGGTAVLLSVVVGLVAFAAFSFVIKFPVSPFEGMAAAAKGLPQPKNQTGFELGGPTAIFISILPVLVSAVALFFALNPRRRTVWLICVFVTLALVTLGSSAGLPCVIFLGFGYYKTSKAERV